MIIFEQIRFFIQLFKLINCSFVTDNKLGAGINNNDREKIGCFIIKTVRFKVTGSKFTLPNSWRINESIHPVQCSQDKEIQQFS